MSVMSNVYIDVVERLERGFSPTDVAYQLTCEYPEMDLALAIKLVGDVDRLEREYLQDLN